jgi:hypothetical protein
LNRGTGQPKSELQVPRQPATNLVSFNFGLYIDHVFCGTVQLLLEYHRPKPVGKKIALEIGEQILQKETAVVV